MDRTIIGGVRLTTGHEYAVYAAIGGITGITIFALFLGAADGLVAAAIAALATLGGVKLAQGSISA